ncbi:hypothetical protein T492DRAFT_2933 [Pavlovales sp. CCMP2436]|nr:hypothetical protein T492DRAFT_2933 [Pavlovales sp. CCMP2436]|mmetsp:Transcript_19898/g.50720  ORF Transcript_19898/g.50720 Transcript_19898/m.50720 type:complete len:338 (-) Transcript_19898:254-1267(-)
MFLINPHPFRIHSTGMKVPTSLRATVFPPLHRAKNRVTHLNQNPSISQPSEKFHRTFHSYAPPPGKKCRRRPDLPSPPMTPPGPESQRVFDVISGGKLTAQPAQRLGSAARGLSGRENFRSYRMLQPRTPSAAAAAAAAAPPHRRAAPDPPRLSRRPVQRQSRGREEKIGCPRQHDLCFRHCARWAIRSPAKPARSAQRSSATWTSRRSFTDPRTPIRVTGSPAERSGVRTLEGVRAARARGTLPASAVSAVSCTVMAVCSRHAAPSIAPFNMPHAAAPPNFQTLSRRCGGGRQGIGWRWGDSRVGPHTRRRLRAPSKRDELSPPSAPPLKAFPLDS